MSGFLMPLQVIPAFERSAPLSFLPTSNPESLGSPLLGAMLREDAAEGEGKGGEICQAAKVQVQRKGLTFQTAAVLLLTLPWPLAHSQHSEEESAARSGWAQNRTSGRTKHPTPLRLTSLEVLLVP